MVLLSSISICLTDVPCHHREVIQPDVMEEMVVSCVIKHLNLVDALHSLINFQYQEEHAEEYDLLCKIMGETFKKLNAMERQLQVSENGAINLLSGTEVSSHWLSPNAVLTDCPHFVLHLLHVVWSTFLECG